MVAYGALLSAITVRTGSSCKSAGYEDRCERLARRVGAVSALCAALGQ